MSGDIDFYDNREYGENRSGGYFQNHDFDIQQVEGVPSNDFFDKDERVRGDIDERLLIDDYYETGRRDDRFRREQKDFYSGANRDDNYNANRDSRDGRGRDLSYSRANERNRERDRDRDRDRGRYRDRDRDDKREFERRHRQRGSESGYRNNDDYPDSRDRDRDKDRDRTRERDRDRPRDGERSRDRDSDRDRDSLITHDSPDKPSTVITLRGLPSNVLEEHIQVEIDDFGVPVKDIILARKLKGKKSGASRGFAFVEFQNLSDATRWMEQNQGRIKLRGHWVVMNYSKPTPQREHDWNCSKCGAFNFKRRDMCFMCNISREESAQYSEDNYDGTEEVSSEVNTTLLVRGLDVLTTEDKVCAALGAVTTVSIQNVRVARDSLTNTSRGFCYVDFATTQQSTEVLNVLNALKAPITIDSKKVTVSYAKQNIKSSVGSSGSTTTNVALAAIAAAMWSTSASQQQQIQQQVEAEQQQQQQQQYDYASYYQQYGSAATAAEYSQYYQQQLQQAQAAVSANASKESEESSDIVAIAQQQVAAARQYQVQQQQLQQHIVANMQQQQQQSLASLDPQERLKMEAQQWTQHQIDTPEIPEEKRGKRGRRRKEQAAYQKQTSADYQRQVSNESAGSSAAESKHQTPDVSTYQYDATSGYYYDTTTGLHYDAKSQYYYNSQTGQYLYWDAQKSTYLPAPNATATTSAEQGAATVPKPPPPPPPTTMTATAPTPTKSTAEGGKEKEKKEKVIIAKKIAKDMERWAKSMNQAKDSVSGKKSSGTSITEMEKSSASADAGFAVLEKKSTLTDKSASMLEQLKRVQDRRKEEEAKKKVQLQDLPPIVASYGGESDSESEHEMDELKMTESVHIDFKLLACLLCKRQFPNKDNLVKHQQVSELHKQNLDVWRRTQMSKKELNEMERREREAKYRDRAKERREKFGVPEPPEPKKRRKMEATINYEQPTKAGIGNDNIGNKMLQAMGWSEGTGLGRKRQGRKAPIEVNRRQAGAGLGMKGASYGATATNSYKEQVKKLMQYRFEELCNDGEDDEDES